MKKLSRKMNDKMVELYVRGKSAVTNERGDMTISQSIIILIAIVLGALLLKGLYEITEDTVLPTIKQRIVDMFDYSS